MQEELIEEVEKPCNERSQYLIKELTEGLTHKEDTCYKQAYHLDMLERMFEEWMTINRTEVNQEIGEEIINVLCKTFTRGWPANHIEINSNRMTATHIIIDGSNFFWDPNDEMLHLPEDDIPF